MLDSELPDTFARRLLKTVADHSFDAITITRAPSTKEPGEIVYVNGAFEELTGYAADEVLGDTPGVLQGPKTEQEVLSRLGQKLEAGEVFHGRATNYRKDGSEFTMEWTVIPVADAANGEELEGGPIYHVAVQREAPDA
ncbi:MAG: PAS domain S-box protein [Salinibacter sp.]|uniref:PAS domain-containing protein n=1 Tax=Salinibacter sp. TaxID=2065818 RepID=UPI002FC3999F